MELNRLGFQAYQEDRLIDAARLWNAAIRMDPENPWPHYNYASVLAVFVNGFGDFSVPEAELVEFIGEKDEFWPYRDAIFHHLKTSIILRPDRRNRAGEDSDFDSVRLLPDFINLMMGPYPDPETVMSIAPEWYSLQPGAFLPKDSLHFRPDGTVEYVWDAEGRLYAFPELFNEGDDEAFTGTWRLVGEAVEITTEDGVRYFCEFAHRTDEHGFIGQRVLIFDGVRFGDYEAHYWEGQDG